MATSSHGGSSIPKGQSPLRAQQPRGEHPLNTEPPPGGADPPAKPITPPRVPPPQCCAQNRGASTPLVHPNRAPPSPSMQDPGTRCHPAPRGAAPNVLPPPPHHHPLCPTCATGVGGGTATPSLASLGTKAKVGSAAPSRACPAPPRGAGMWGAPPAQGRAPPIPTTPHHPITTEPSTLNGCRGGGHTCVRRAHSRVPVSPPQHPCPLGGPPSSCVPPSLKGGGVGMGWGGGGALGGPPARPWRGCNSISGAWRSQ